MAIKGKKLTRAAHLMSSPGNKWTTSVAVQAKKLQRTGQKENLVVRWRTPPSDRECGQSLDELNMVYDDNDYDDGELIFVHFPHVIFARYRSFVAFSNAFQSQPNLLFFL